MTIPGVGGAPNRYETEVKDKLILVAAWARDGLSNEQIANNLGISETAFYEYKNKYTEFAEALYKNKEIANIEVENAAFKKACGYHIQIPQQQVTKDGDVVDYTQTIYVQPDSTLIKFILTNRKPETWKDKQEIVNISKDGDLSSLSDEELESKVKDTLKKLNS